MTTQQMEQEEQIDHYTTLTNELEDAVLADFHYVDDGIDEGPADFAKVLDRVLGVLLRASAEIHSDSGRRWSATKRQALERATLAHLEAILANRAVPKGD
jgi:hypothetical protein